MEPADSRDYLCFSLHLSEVSLEWPSPVSKPPEDTSRECSAVYPRAYTVAKRGGISKSLERGIETLLQGSGCREEGAEENAHSQGPGMLSL